MIIFSHASEMAVGMAVLVSPLESPADFGDPDILLNVTVRLKF